VQSVLGEGSVFTIKLPALMPESAPDGARARAFAGENAVGGEAQPGTSYVLVIDDDPAPRERLQRYLTQEGYTVRTAASGPEGLLLARTLHPAAITLDVMMPEMDGWSVLKALKADAELRNIPVIMLTMVDDPERGFALGAAEYATKPVDRQRLSATVRRYVHPGPESLVLMVEDDPATRAMMRNVLAKEGWRMCEAVNGRAGLECMEAERPDLILLDLMMPEMDGFEFADQVHRNPEWRNVPIVVITAHDLSVRDRQRLSGYVETILQKRGDSHESLLSRVRELLNDFAVPRSVISTPDADETPAV
jgi:CheY-like chemotaxis protein